MRYQDIVGAEDIVGDDTPQGPHAVDRGPPQKNRQMPLGFPSTLFAAGVTLNVTATTQELFRGRRLVIPTPIAASFVVNDLKVGKNSQFSTTGPVPGEVFSERAVGVDLLLDTAQISQTITLNLTNLSVGPVTFTATLLGDSAEN